MFSEKKKLRIEEKKAWIYTSMAFSVSPQTFEALKQAAGVAGLFFISNFIIYNLLCMCVCVCFCRCYDLVIISVESIWCVNFMCNVDWYLICDFIGFYIV